jgi:AraC-like DNA-binding protein
MIRNYSVDSISQYNADNNHPTLHPLVSVIDFSKAAPRSGGSEIQRIKFHYGLYCVYLKDVKCGDIVYGRHTYDYQAGTLVFFAPGQVSEFEIPAQAYQPKGYGLVFHPDLVHGTSLGKALATYHFFSYQSNEALHISYAERQVVLDCFSKIAFELSQSIDKHSKKLITANIELFLSYCERFYDRQFISREHVNKGVLARFEEQLNTYFLSDKPSTLGLPSVAYFAEQLHLSPNYFGDLIKRETGQSVKEMIQNKLIDVAKDRVFDGDKTVNQIAYELGFKYPQHFTRLFKQRVGNTPLAYRNLN